MAEAQRPKISEERFAKGRFLVHALRQRHGAEFLRDRNITGLAFGRRIAHGETTDEPALVVYVLRKAPRRILPPSRLLPRRMYVGADCVEVDVVETGPIYALSFTARERPATAGISIGHLNVTAGTLGAVVTDNTDGSQCILSNNHVMGDSNSAVAGDAIVQPGVFDGGGAPADTIATFKRLVMLSATGTNRVDGAIAQTLKGEVIDQVHNNIIPTANADHPAVGLLFAGGCNRTIMNPIADVLSQLNISFPTGANAIVGADIDMNVEKVGRTTEYTTSTITEIDATVVVSGYPWGDTTFDGQITTAWMSDGGDSGSVVYRGGAGGSEDKCGCGTTSAAAGVLGADLKQEQCMAEVVRDRFLRPTRLGRYGVDLFFANEERLLERFERTPIDPDDREYARRLFEKYRQEATAAFVEGESGDRKITEAHLREARTALKRAQKYMSRDEREASERLFKMAAERAQGRTARELLAMLNDEQLLKEVQDVVGQVKFIRQRDDSCK